MNGAFLLSLDVELAWGGMNPSYIGRIEAKQSEIRAAFKEFVQILESRQIRATWAFVCHLLLDACSKESGKAHPDLHRPEYAWFDGDWMSKDPCTNLETDPAYYATDLLHILLQSDLKHEIACHSFSHLLFDDPGCSAQAAQSDLAKCVSVSKDRGIQLKSFVFPEDRIGHLSVLKRNGFLSYRGPDPVIRPGRPTERKRALWRRFYSYFHDLFGFAIRDDRTASRTEEGLIEIPGSLFFRPLEGWSRLIPMTSRIRTVKRSIAYAAKKKGIFHLHFHPHNLVPNSRAMLKGLAEIFDYVAYLRSEGLLDVMTMEEFAVQYCAAIES